VAGCLLAAASPPLGWAWPSGVPAGNRVVAGKGTFPHWQPLSIATDVPLRWIVAFPPHGLAALDGDGTFWVFEVARTGLSVSGRYGSVASADASLVVVRLDRDRTGVALVGPDGRLLLWGDGVLRAYDVGSRLSRLTGVVPVSIPGRQSHDLLAVAQDGAVVLIGGLTAGGPRAVARLDAHALLDGRITLADVDGDGMAEAVILSDPTNRYAHGVQGHGLDAASVTVIGLRPHGLELRGRFTLPPPAVFEALVPVVAPLFANPRPAAVLLVRSTPEQGASVVALGWRDERLALLAESPGLGQGQRSLDLVGAADLSGDDTPEIIAVAPPHARGGVTAYRRVGTSLQRMAQAAGYSSRAVGSRNLPEALIADLDGDGKPEVVVARQSRDALVGLGLDGARFVTRWSVDLRRPFQSNLLVADLEGDGLLDLAVADLRALHLFLSIR
jgi:hypothetical protein